MGLIRSEVGLIFYVIWEKTNFSYRIALEPNLWYDMSVGVILQDCFAIMYLSANNKCLIKAPSGALMFIGSCLVKSV